MGSSPIGNPSSAGCRSGALPHWGRAMQATPGLCTWLHPLLQPLHTLAEVVSVGICCLVPHGHPCLHRRPWRPCLRFSWELSRQSSRCENSARRRLGARRGSARREALPSRVHYSGPGVCPPLNIARSRLSACRISSGAEGVNCAIRATNVVPRSMSPAEWARRAADVRRTH
jgi:hypothetical protein